MKIFGAQLFNTSAWDGVGFKRAEMEKVVKEYLEKYNQASTDYPVGRSTKGRLNPETYEPYSAMQVPLSSPENPMSPIRVESYQEDTPSYGFANCRLPSNSEISVIGQVMDNINGQLRDWGMPNIQLESHLTSTQPGPSAPGSNPNNNAAPLQTTIAMSVCGKLSKSAAGYMETKRSSFASDGTFIYETPQPRIVLARKNHLFIRPTFHHLVAHEIAHIVGTHPQDITNLSDVHPDLLQYMCEQPGHHQLGSVLVYKDACLVRGYDGDLFTSNLTGDKFGDLELAQMARSYGNSEAERAQSTELAVKRVVDGIRNNYGQKVASHAVASFCATATQRVLHHAVDSANLTASNKRNLHTAVNLLSNLLRLGILTQILGPYNIGITAIGVPIAGSISDTVKSVARLLSAAGLGMLMLSAVRGNSDVLYSLLACLGGQTAGIVAGELINTLARCCLNGGCLNRPTEYVDRVTHRNINMNNWMDSAEQKLRTVAPPKVADAMATLSALDKKVAHAVDRYARIGFLYDMLPVGSNRNAPSAVVADGLQISELETAEVGEAQVHQAPTSQPETSRFELLSPQQAVELAFNNTTEQDRLEALEEGQHIIQTLEGA
ncbi:MAG: hypothetical protein QE278_06505 [Limnobacter sp.]|nr:hypothetical protein [Limnobacter sp.]